MMLSLQVEICSNSSRRLDRMFSFRGMMQISPSLRGGLRWRDGVVTVVSLFCFRCPDDLWEREPLGHWAETEVPGPFTDVQTY